ncbi:hypothetical protein OESDEN_00298 [Oesophagostomum dentatum]|uniref:Peptidase M13 C-terminal domain-containing protein n=1 Tax=Oesophagostomum dentatum TaxID=61180 RepID=A0A0B1TUA5_OESDE|nr:hypothetical protein OESDEN_00298 [Oesophagostomum dentatum]
MISGLKSTTERTKTHAKEKAKGMVKNYGWPRELFGNLESGASIDPYHRPDYAGILTLFQQNGTHNYYRIRNTMIKGYSNRESLRLLTEPPKRYNFMMSPALVNAWYIPERNSITFPYASFNPPFYNLKHPQAYNFAGQHTIAGHEIVHGFDDEGRRTLAFK